MPAVSTPARRVHFAEDIQPPRTPSPSWSESSSSASSSSSSSNGPSTPPMHTGAFLPSHPSSDIDDKPAQIHGALAYRPDIPCLLSYDVSVHPSRLPAPQGMSRDQFAELLAQPATHPPMFAMTLVSSILSHPIIVTPAAADKGTGTPQTPSAVLSPGGLAHLPTHYVTVQDVLTTLYTFLRTPLSPDEYNTLASDHQRAVARAYNHRVRRADEHKRESERAKGVKRVDLVLAEGTGVFNGLGATKRSRALWVLNLGS